MNQEQIKKILDDAPEGATHYSPSVGVGGYYKVQGYSWYLFSGGEWGWRESPVIEGAGPYAYTESLSDLAAQLEPEREPTEEEVAKVRELRAMLGFTDGDMIPCGVVAAVAYDKICELMQPEQEWKNGDECIHPLYKWAVFIGLDRNSNGIAVVEGHNIHRDDVIIDKVWLEDLSKPETPEQKAEREREVGAKSIFIDMGYQEFQWKSNPDDAFDTHLEQVISSAYGLFDKGYHQ